MHLFDCLKAINKIIVAYLTSLLNSYYKHFIPHKKKKYPFFVPIHPPPMYRLHLKLQSLRQQCNYFESKIFNVSLFPRHKSYSALHSKWCFHKSFTHIIRVPFCQVVLVFFLLNIEFYTTCTCHHET